MTLDFNDRLRASLADEGRRASRAAPSLEEAVGRLAPRLAPKAQQTSRRLVVILAAALLTAAALGSAIAIGSGRLSLPLVVDTQSDAPSEAEEAVGALQPLPSAGAIDAGTYVMPNPYTDDAPVRHCDRGCSAYDSLVLTLPDGWAITDGLLHKHLGQPGEVAISVWTVDRVYADPCHWQDSILTELDLADHSHGPDGGLELDASSEGGLLNQVGRSASAPTVVPFGGPYFLQPTVRIELSVPSELDITTCDRGEFRSWTEWDVADGANSHHAPGQIDVVYLVDLDRRPLVIDASHMPNTAPADLAELEQILASVRIH